MKAYWSYIRAQLLLLQRDVSVLFLNFLMQLVFLAIFARILGGTQTMIARVLNMVLVISVLGSGFFGAGLRAVTDREKDILRRLKVAPITPLPVIVSSFVTGWISFMPMAFTTIALVHFYYHMPWPEKWISLTVFLSLGVVALRSMGMMIAAVANSMQESQIVIQLLYLPMLFLSGATFPLSMMPDWLQSIGQFLPSSHLFAGMQMILIKGDGLKQILIPVVAMIATTLVGTFVALKLFRWEKEEKIAASAKVWIIILFLPFIMIGAWQLHSKRNLAMNKTIERDLRRSHALLLKNVRVIVGDGAVMEQASVLLKGGKIAGIYSQPPDAKQLGAEEEECAGKTLMPGLIDVDTYLSSPGGVIDKPEFYDPDRNVPRRLASYLFAGVTGVVSVGDSLGLVEKQAKKDDSGEQLGSELFYSGPVFKVNNDQGSEFLKLLPASLKAQVPDQTAISPKTQADAAQLLEALKKRGASEVEIVLGSSSNRMDSGTYNAIVAAARSQGLPVVTHTHDLSDVLQAIDAGTTVIQADAGQQAIPAVVFERMKAQSIYFDPTLSAYEAITDIAQRKTDLLDRPLLLSTGPLPLVQSTKEWIQSGKAADSEQQANSAAALDTAKKNLVEAWRAGVTLVTGSHAGKAVILHGPTVHREVELWVETGLPPAVALTAATGNSARLLHMDDRIGFVKQGYDATLLLVDGNPLKDINAIEAISSVFLKGERIDRGELFKEYDKKE